MRVIARDGSAYLISLEDDLEKVNADVRAQGQVLDVSAGILYPPTGLHSIYTKGYWDDCEVSAHQLDEWLKVAKPARAA